MIVVADTSPLNYLVLIDEIALLPALFQKVLIPPGRLRRTASSWNLQQSTQLAC